jgi:hypothetical protein
MVLTSGFVVPARTATPRRTRKIHVRPGGNHLRGDQLTESLPGQDHHVRSYAAAELRGNRLRARSLRRTRAGRNLHAAHPLEFRQQPLVRASESSGYQNVQLRRFIHHV